MTGDTRRLACAACGWTPGPLEVDPYPFRCPNAGTDDGDHVVSSLTADAKPLDSKDLNCTRCNYARGDDARAPNPFIRFRTSLYSWHVARSRGLSDADYMAIVERVDAAVARVAGCGFRVTPFSRGDRLSERLGFESTGGVWVKDETGNVAGSHKGRHLMGVALYLEVLRQLGIDRDARRPLAVASCGNAALAAAVVARAIDRRLLVFVPEHASPAIVTRLEQLGAAVTRCTRNAGVTGDPSYAAFRDAVSRGALPFSCQGNENGLAIEGAMTLGYEMVDASDSASTGQESSPAGLDRVFIQVGGGALASACIQAFAACVHAGRLGAMPRIHAVQTCGAHPLKRAYDRLVDHLLERLARSAPGTRPALATDDDRARYLLDHAPVGFLDEAIGYARSHRSEFMRPWETEPRSVAGGILDDETYDWAVLVEAMVRSGGFPVVVDEATLEEANDLARETTAIDVDHTGSSGLAGLVACTRSLDKPRPAERIAVLFTGARR
jgi:threonine synthase